MQEATDKSDDWVVDIAKKTVADALKTCGVDRNKSLIKSALICALNELLVSVLDDTSGIR